MEKELCIIMFYRLYNDKSVRRSSGAAGGAGGGAGAGVAVGMEQKEQEVLEQQKPWEWEQQEGERTSMGSRGWSL